MLEEINSIIKNGEEWGSNLEDRIMKITNQSNIKKGNIFIKKNSLTDLWNNIKSMTTHIIGAPEGQEREKGAEELPEIIMCKSFPNLGK